MQVRRWISAVGVCCALIAAGGCGIAGAGVRTVEDGGDATTGAVPDAQADPAEGEAFSIDPVEVLRDDPDVREDIKDLVARPCTDATGDWFPVDTIYATISGTEIQVAIVNVLGCTDPYLCASGYAAYVYRLWEDGAEQVYAVEDVSYSVMVTDGELAVGWSEWLPDDPADCPTGYETAPLAWDGERFTAEGA